MIHSVDQKMVIKKG